MGFNFTRFTDPGSSYLAKITIRQRTGQFGFNAGAMNKYCVGKFSFAVLFFDEAARVVGIKLTNEKEEGAIKIAQRESNTYFVGKNFLDKYGIDYSRSRRYDLHRDQETRFLYFHIDQETKEAEEADSDDQPAMTEDEPKPSETLSDLTFDEDVERLLGDI